MGEGRILAGRRPTEATISLPALRANFAAALRLAAGRDVIAVVKADAYGHGAVPIATALARAGCGRLATVTVDEAVALRDAGLRAPILVMGGVHDPEEAAEVVARGLTAAVHGSEQIPWLADAARRVSDARLPVHVEVDTGMHRMGVPPDDALALLCEIRDEVSLSLEGVYTHLARAGSQDLSHSQDQLDCFQNLLFAARNRGVDPGIVHFASSAGLMVGSRLLDMMGSDAVRPGLLLYGVHTDAERVGELQPVMTLRTRVIALRTLHKGESVGYEGTFRATRDTRIATLPIGYGDGIPVSASNRATVLIGGRRLPVVGRTSMDYITIDVAREGVSIGDEAILFGSGQGAGLPVEEAASAADTIAYELLVRIGSRVPRVIED